MARKLFFVVGVLSLVLVGMRGVAQANEPDGVYNILGYTFCTAEAPADRTCDWRPPDTARERPRPRASALSLFGWTVCFGEAAPGTRCDLTIPARAKSAESDRQARL